MARSPQSFESVALARGVRTFGSPGIVAVMLVLLAAAPARAQKAAAVAVGLSFDSVNPTSADAESSTGPHLLVRLRGPQGLGPGIGFNWFSSDVKTTIGDERTYLGRLTVRPVMVGVGYTRRFQKFETDFSFEAGYAFNNIRATGLARAAYARQGARVLSLHASNSLAWKGQTSFWFELGEKYGLVASVGYIGVSPRVTTTSSVGSVRQRVNLGSVVTAVGISYAVF